MTWSGYHHIDPKVLLDAADDDVAVFRDLCRTFLDIAPPLMSNLENALRDSDRAAAARLSHSLKGTVALVGARQLTALLQMIETAANHPDAPIPDPASSKLLFHSVMQEVRQCMCSAAAGGSLATEPESGV